MFEDPLIKIAHDVCRDLRMTRPATLFANYDEGNKIGDNLQRAATKTGRFLLSYHTWEHLTAFHTWTVTTDEVQPATVAIPVDFHRHIPRTFYDVTHRRFLRESSVDGWSRANAGYAMNGAVAFTREGVRLSCKSTRDVRYNYIRKAVCKTTGQAEIVATPASVSNPCPAPAQPAIPAGLLKPDFTRDDDIPLWDAELFTLGMIWNIQHRDGNVTNEDYQAFVGRLHEMINHDAPSGVLNMGGLVPVDADDAWEPSHPAGWGS